MILIGEISLRVALLMAAWAVILSYTGVATRSAALVASGERGIHATLALLVVASAGLGTALLTSDFSIRYVASFTSANLPAMYALAAFWAGPSGSLLLCALILAAYSTVAACRRRDREYGPYFTGTLAGVVLCLLAAISLLADPFERLEWLPADGLGLPPLLQSPGMLTHAPTMYLGLVATTIPFALAAAALMTGRLTPAIVDRIRRWSLAAWFLTTVGILIGMRWAYVEPHWDSYWVLNPVTNGSVLPWLAGSALVYSLMKQVERGVVRGWNVILVVAVFLLAVLAALVSRSGTLSGSDAVVQSPVGLLIAGSLVAAIILVGALVVARLQDLEVPVELRESRPAARFRRRFGSYALGVGMAVLAAGFVGQALGRGHAVTLRPGEAVTLTDPYGRGWRFVSEGMSRYDILNRHVTALTMAVYRGDSRSDLLTTEVRHYVDSRGIPAFEPSTEIGLIETPLQDVYALLVRVASDDAVEMQLGFTPLVWWVWLGGAVVALGGLVALWPQRANPQDRPPDGRRWQ